MTYYNPYKEELTDERLELVSEESFNDVKILHYLLHPKTTNECPICKSNDVIKNGQKIRRLKIKLLAHCKVSVSVQYTRFQCKKCSKMFVDQFDDVSKGLSISKNTVYSIMTQLKTNLSFKDIARDNQVSDRTIINIMENTIVAERKPFKDVLCWDEFKNLRTSEGKYAFLIYDPNARKVVDVLPDRRQDHLEDYFYQISYEERNRVKYIVTDMNESYRTIINMFFPNCTHIIDSFHYIRYVTQAFNNVRIRTQQKFKIYTYEYKILKQNWKILMTYINDLDNYYVYNIKCKRKTSKSEIVTDSLMISNELEEAYNLLQDFLSGWHKVKYENAKYFIEEWIEKLHNTSIPEFKELEKTFRNWKNEIINSFIRFGESRLQNGTIEGVNNRIKTLKRACFGFTNFYHFRLRIICLINQELQLRDINKLLLIPRKTRNKNREE